MPIGDGRAVVATAGTRVQVSVPSIAITSAAITALETNVGKIVIGGPTVVAAAGTRRGTPLAAGETYSIDRDDQVDDLSQVWIDATANGDGVSYSYTRKG
jgi:hypothetical protein